MAQKTFTQYMSRPSYVDPMVAEAERATRAAEKAYDALRDARAARRVAKYAAFAASESRRPEPTPAFIAAKARKQQKYDKYLATITKESRANADVVLDRSQRQQAARAFDPQSSITVLDYATTAYPSARGAEMGLQCPVFYVRVRASPSAIVASAIRSDGTVMGKVSAAKDYYYLSVSWSSLLEGGESLHSVSRTTDFRRCGVGPRLYEAVAAYACKNKLTMTSDTTLYPNSRKFWERQQEKGRAWYNEDAERFVVFDACGIQRTGMRGLGKRGRKKRKK
jgi:GNAT superfamily N-acetyltransferase